MSSPRERPRLLIVAGHDPSGAGVDANVEAARSAGVEPVVVVTARTEQDDHGVYAVGARAPQAWLDEALAHARGAAPARARGDEAPVRASSRARVIDGLKLGLLPGVEHVRAAVALVRALRASGGPDLPVVVDPVISASSGRRFLFAAAVEALARELAREAVVLTPNLPEAAELARVPLAALLASTAARAAAAETLLARGASAVIVKGGHGGEDPVVDLLVRAGSPPLALRRPRLAGPGMRGSGCRFASHLAAGLALGRPLEQSAREAGDWVAQRIAARAAVETRSHGKSGATDAG